MFSVAMQSEKVFLGKYRTKLARYALVIRPIILRPGVLWYCGSLML